MLYVIALKPDTKEIEDDIETLKHKLHEKDKKISELQNMVDEIQKQLGNTRSLISSQNQVFSFGS